MRLDLIFQLSYEKLRQMNRRRAYRPCLFSQTRKVTEAARKNEFQSTFAGDLELGAGEDADHCRFPRHRLNVAGRGFLGSNSERRDPARERVPAARTLLEKHRPLISPRDEKFAAAECFLDLVDASLLWLRGGNMEASGTGRKTTAVCAS